MTVQLTPSASIGFVAVAGLCATAAVVVGTTSGAATTGHAASHRPAVVSGNGSTADAAATGGLDNQIARVQQQLRDVPRDWNSWATLGLDYVQQAKITVDPTYYPKADGALRRSLHLNTTDNIAAMAGEASLAAARHDFHAALAWANRGLAIDARNGVLLGALCDAQTQLGDYAAAQTAAQRMEAVDPGTDAEARLSYAAELRGDVPSADRFMRAALADAGSPADVAFTSYYLGDLALGSGHPDSALADFTAGLHHDPAYVALLEGRARAEHALGNDAAALHDFATVVDRVPQPGYVLEYAELLESLGRHGAATEQYALFKSEEQLFRANGVTLDTDETLFEADHGSVDTALAVGRAALVSRPFVDSYDAYAWALHKAGRDREALGMSARALATGMHNALFRFHRGVIEHALRLDRAAAADLRAALQINPWFNPLQATFAKRLLAQLDGAR